MKRIGLLFTMIVMFAMFTFSANAASESNLIFILNPDSNSYSVSTDDFSVSGSLTIPATYNGKAVTTIASSAFYDCTNITSVTIPQSVTSIGSWAFSGCESLTSVTIPDSVISIDKGAFSGCKSLTSVTIPGSVTSIGSRAFTYCTNLTSITVDEDNVNYCSVDGVLFNKDKTMLMQYPSGNVSASYKIPDGVKDIGESAFCMCDSLTSITIPNGVISIGTRAFEFCSNFTSIAIPDSVISIGAEAFYCCSSLSGVVIPDSVISIDEGAFSGCESLTSVTIPESVTSIGSLAFHSCNSLISITVDEDNKNYCSMDGALFSKDKKTLVQYPVGVYTYLYEIPKGVTSIEESAFCWCYSLKRIIIPDSVTSIGNKAFYSCSDLMYVYYTGSEIEWNEINIGTENEYLNNARIYFNWIDHNHSYEEKITKLPTHVEEGIKSFNCTCGCTYKEPVAKIPHLYNPVVIDPTCTERGYTIYICECGDSYIENYVNANGHSYTLQITKQPTHFEEGIKTFFCECGHSYTESMSKVKEHSYAVSNIIAPTCENEGYTVYVCECGHSYNGDKISATGHSYSEDVCKNCGESKIDNCTCNCHKGGFRGLIWKILRFFYKLFGMNKTCSCGISHY